MGDFRGRSGGEGAGATRAKRSGGGNGREEKMVGVCEVCRGKSSAVLHLQ